MRTLVIGASGRVGGLVSQALEQKGEAPFKSYRTKRMEYSKEDHWLPLDLELSSSDDIVDILKQHNITCVIYCLSLKYVHKVTAALKGKNMKAIFLGSARKFSQIKDRSVDKVKNAVQSAQDNCNDWFFIHPTMIYGRGGENNFNRIANLIKKTPVIALPSGGSALMQPIYVTDVSQSLVNAMSLERPNKELILAGPDCVTYKNIFEKIAKQHGKSLLILNMPIFIIHFVSLFLNILPFLPSITKSEINRLVENKNYDTQETYDLLALKPVGLDQGIKLTFSGQQL